MKVGVNQQRQINVEARSTCELKCKDTKQRRKMAYMVSDWLSHTGYKETAFKGCHDTQPSSSPWTLCLRNVGWYIYIAPKRMALLFETSRSFYKLETLTMNISYLEILSGEQAEMLVSMLSELSRLKVSKAWSL